MHRNFRNLAKTPRLRHDSEFRISCEKLFKVLLNVGRTLLIPERDAESVESVGFTGSTGGAGL